MWYYYDTWTYKLFVGRLEIDRLSNSNHGVLGFVCVSSFVILIQCRLFNES